MGDLVFTIAKDEFKIEISKKNPSTKLLARHIMLSSIVIQK